MNYLKKKSKQAKENQKLYSQLVTHKNKLEQLNRVFIKLISNEGLSFSIFLPYLELQEISLFSEVCTTIKQTCLKYLKIIKNPNTKLHKQLIERKNRYNRVSKIFIQRITMPYIFEFSFCPYLNVSDMVQFSRVNLFMKYKFFYYARYCTTFYFDFLREFKRIHHKLYLEQLERLEIEIETKKKSRRGGGRNRKSKYEMW